ncbi:MAG: DUF6541 family protein [Thermocrispum sp.]
MTLAKPASLPPTCTDTAELLARRFNAYSGDPEVRAAVARLKLRWVIVGRDGFLPNFGRQPGMTDLRDAPFLQLEYRNAEAAVYRIVGRQQRGEPDDGGSATPGPTDTRPMTPTRACPRSMHGVHECRTRAHSCRTCVHGCRTRVHGRRTHG